MSSQDNFGFCKLFRGELQHFWPDPEMLRAYLWLKANAAYGDVNVPAISGRQRFTIKLKRGQLAHASTFMAKALDCGETTVRRLLANLEEKGFIKSRKFRGRRIITLCFYDRNYCGGQTGDQTSDVTPCNDEEFLTAASESGDLTGDKVKNLRTDNRSADFDRRSTDDEYEEEGQPFDGGWLGPEFNDDSREELSPPYETAEGEEPVASGRPSSTPIVPPAVCPPRPPKPIDWRDAAKAWKDGVWHADWGPTPNEDGCRFRSDPTTKVFFPTDEERQEAAAKHQRWLAEKAANEEEIDF